MGRYNLEFDEKGRDLLTAIGAVSVVAVWAERELIWLMAGVGQIRFERASAIFYSTASAKARLDMIRALVPLSGVPDGLAAALVKALNKVARLSDRRNDLIHGEISDSDLHPGQAFLVVRKSATANPKRMQPIKADDVWALVSDYGKLMESLSELHDDVAYPVSRGSWSGKYPQPPPPDRRQTRSPSQHKAPKRQPRS